MSNNISEQEKQKQIQEQQSSIPQIDLKYFDEEELKKNLWLRIKKSFIEFKKNMHRIGTSRFSIMIFPHSHSKGINLHVSNYILIFFGFIITVSAITTTVILATGQKNSRHQQRLIAENGTLEKKYYSVAQTVDSLSDYFAQFRLEVDSIISSPIQSSEFALNDPELSLDINEEIPKEILQLQKLQREFDVTKEQILQIGAFMQKKQRTLREIPSIYPVATRARITSRFGLRRNPFDQRGVEGHEGLDLATLPGTPVYATADGVISFAGVRGGYGNLADIEHKYGYRTRYGHLQGFAPQVYSGARVKQGQVIGYVGATGRVTGYHLHYEVLIGNQRVDPEPFAMMLR